MTGAEVQVPARKERAVLAFLALRAGSDVSGAGLIRALWGDDPPRSATKTLQTYVSALRRVLPAGTIETTGSGYRLAISPDDVDVHRFEKLLRSSSEAMVGGDLRRAAEDTTAALALWRGSPLPDLADEPIGMAEAERLAEMRRTAEERNFAARLALGEHAELVAELEIAVAAEPLRERRWEQLMVALYRSGRQSEALRAYQRLRTVLSEAGLEPGEEARALEAAHPRSRPGNRVWRPSQLSRRPEDGRSDRLPRGNVTFLFTDIERSTSCSPGWVLATTTSWRRTAGCCGPPLSPATAWR